MADSIEHSLINETLKIWYPRCYDTVYNGYISTFTYDFHPQGDQQKMIVTQARHMWVNSRASEDYPAEKEKYEKGAHYGLVFLRDKMWDKRHGGFYSLVSRDGTPVDASKSAYGNAFGIYALSAYYHAFNDTSALHLAQKAFLWLEKNSHDAVNKGYYQHLREDGSKILYTPAMDMKEETADKDQNSSIHLLEAFSELYQVWPDPLVRERLEEMLVLIRDTMVTKEGYLVLFFTPDWKPISYRDSADDVRERHRNVDHISFGHDVETAYLMLEASHILGKENDSTTLNVSKRMLDHSLRNGWDEMIGGFYDGGYYFKGENDVRMIMDTKNWWAQAEGLNTLLLFADMFPNDDMHYFERFEKQWRYIDTYLIDHEHGDWYAGGLDKEPSQKQGLKGHLWKATYHHYRALSNCVHALRNKKTSAPE